MAEERELYKYSPSVAAAIIFVIVFVVLTSYHAFRLFKTRSWFCIPFLLGGLFEIIGYGARAYGNKNHSSLGPYIMQALLILLAPILFAASVYMFLGRTIRATGCASYSIIRTNWLTKIFVLGDVICFLIQALGAAMLSSADDKKAKDRGQKFILLGLVLQIVIFSLFMLVAVVFQMRVRKRSAGKTLSCNFDWQKYLFMLYTVSIVITIRNAFRVIEYAMGEEGYLLANEWPIYVFDATLMAVVLVVCATWYLESEVFESTGQNLELMAGDVEDNHRPRH
ncbi:RTA1-domain-containing protein [Melanomma pulvis-pyrius CBS 109.77]|uniref:RTA1-domain-containing protein n=1 Tax=Melanomma pulvis-pyrius CBS 109.77 TaxID=1314802 RepID=A0A6A6X1Z1_9PLEO|nr:RTA1-domain-containing protein [Melanomma pulvis-pyrius CBS 109.77]